MSVCPGAPSREPWVRVSAALWPGMLFRLYSCPVLPFSLSGYRWYGPCGVAHMTSTATRMCCYGGCCRWLVLGYGLYQLLMSVREGSSTLVECFGFSRPCTEYSIF